jgi:AraC family L-rhamnose operon transcriptional activator RhaR/AraC family L-rhamnose operon regulatory protein RhaS
MIDRTEKYFRGDFWSIDWCSAFIQHLTIDHDYAQHRHEFSETFIIFSGSAIHKIGAYAYPIKRGDVFAVKGDIAHGFSQVQNLELVNLMYDPVLFVNEWNELHAIPGFESLFITPPDAQTPGDYPSRFKLCDRDLDHAHFLIDFIIEHLALHDEQYRPVIRLSFLALIAYLSTHYIVDGASAHKMKAVEAALNYMQTNMKRPIRLSEIATSAMVSPRHLERMFQSRYGLSPGKYLTQMRLRQAFNMLINDNDAVKNVACACGFPDPAYFSRIFRQEFGMTPNMARRYIK